MNVRQLKRKLMRRCLLSGTISRTEWYRSLFLDIDHDLYPGNEWYRKHEERNFDIINLGSSSGKWAFDYRAVPGIRGMNWAQQPQTLVEDYNLLRNFHSILRKGGHVLITIMPFTSLNKTTGLKDALRYLRLGAHEPIETRLLGKARRHAEFPILFGKPAIKAMVKHLLGRERKPVPLAAPQADTNPMSAAQLKANALSFAEGWKKQFGIEEWEAPLTATNQEGRDFRVALLREMVDFCTERGYTPVYIIPPVTKHLAAHFTTAFEELYIYSFLREVGRDVLTLDYSKENEWQEDDLYFNCFFLNRRGRTLFTRRVLSDLGLCSRETAPLTQE